MWPANLVTTILVHQTAILCLSENCIRLLYRRSLSFEGQSWRAKLHWPSSRKKVTMDPREVYNVLVSGVTELCVDDHALPSQLLLTGQKAVPICANESGQVLVAASSFGLGRIVVFGHEEYLNNPSFKQLLKNALAWVTRDKTKVIVGIEHCLTNLKQYLEEGDHTVKCVSCVDQGLDVYCTDVCNVEPRAQEMIQFVKSGGGLIVGGQACHWAPTNPCQDVLTEFTGNHITGAAGIYFTAQNVLIEGILKVPREMPHTAVWVPNIVSNEQDLSCLLDCISEFQLNDSSIPSKLLVHGQLAFPVAQDDSGHTFIAAARYGLGRVVVVSHEANVTHPPLRPFIMNAINWLRQGRPDKEISIHTELQPLLQTVCEEFPCKMAAGLSGHEAVFCCPSGNFEAEEVIQFVAEGGGLLTGGQSWWWAQVNKGQEAMSDYPGNKYLNQFGIAISPFTLEKSVTYKAASPADASQLYHFRSEVSRLLEDSRRTNVHQAFKNIVSVDAFVENCSSYVRMGAHEDAQYLALKQTLSRLLTNAEMPIPSETCPIKQPEERFVLQLATDLFNVTPCQGGKSVPDTDSSSQRVSVDALNKANGAAWRSTGLYVPPETEVIISNFSPSVTGKNIKLQIGCQTDDLSDCAKLKRPAVVTRRLTVTAEEVSVSSLWGGLLYVVVPPNCNVGVLEITVKNAVTAPYFKRGKTSTDEWLSTLRNLPAPWAELETDDLILTVPSEWVKTLEAPDVLMQQWDRIMDAIFELAGTRLLRPERIVADVQTRRGFMHSGYPVMIHQKSIPDILDLNRIKNNGTWGVIHELGHNQQRKPWEFRPHTSEATCNIWAVYVHETVLGIPRHEAHGKLTEDQRKKRIQDYLNNGAKLTDWTLWTCLETYLQLQEGFGWNPFIRVFDKYLKIPSNGDWTKQQKMSQWVKEFSLEVNKNLVPFFQAWGWVIDPPVVESVSKLTEWFEDPMTTQQCSCE